MLAVFQFFGHCIAAVPDLDCITAEGREAGGNDLMRHCLGRQHLFDASAAIPSVLELFDIYLGKAFVVQVTMTQAPVDGRFDFLL